MCFASPKAPPPPQAPAPPPSALQANQEGTRSRQDAARRAKLSGLESTMTSGMGGVTEPANVGRPTLGS